MSPRPFARSRVLLGVMLTLAVPLLGAPRPRLIRPAAVYVGQVQVVVAYVLSDAVLEEARLQEQELLAAGLRLIGNRLVGDPVPAAGFRVHIGSQQAMVRTDGSFMVLRVLADVTHGEVVGKEGALRATFAVQDHLAPLGGNPKPIVMDLELSDRPNLMNEWDQPDGATGIHADHHHHEGRAALACPAPDPATCTQDPNCPRNPTTCCLDYDGLCANGNRYAGKGCKLRFLQFAGST